LLEEGFEDGLFARKRGMEMSSEIPSAGDINVYGSLDEQTAVEHFLGKDLREAEEMFRGNFGVYQEDLMWMGPRAFCFYVRAAMNYLCSDSSDGDCDGVSWFCMVVGFQFEHYGQEIGPAVEGIREGIVVILGRLDRFGCEREIYGDVRGEYEALLGWDWEGMTNDE
jgi:hypothetical protein